MKPITKWGLWQSRWSTAWWSLSIVAFVILIMVFYPTFKNQAADLEKTFSSMPEATLQLLGGSAGFFSPIGYLNSQVFYLTLPMLLGILAISLGSKLIAREEQDGTIETLLARPITRSRLLTGKALTGIIILLVVTLVGLAATIISVKLVSLDVSSVDILVATLSCFLLALSFGAIAFMLSSLGRARALSLGVTSAIAIGGYIISSLADTVKWLETPGKLFPFYYYRPEAILNGTYHWLDMIILAAITIVCGVVSWLAFRKRDIY